MKANRHLRIAVGLYGIIWVLSAITFWLFYKKFSNGDASCYCSPICGYASCDSYLVYFCRQSAFAIKYVLVDAGLFFCCISTLRATYPPLT